MLPKCNCAHFFLRFHLKPCHTHISSNNTNRRFTKTPAIEQFYGATRMSNKFQFFGMYMIYWLTVILYRDSTEVYSGAKETLE